MEYYIQYMIFILFYYFGLSFGVSLQSIQALNSFEYNNLLFGLSNFHLNSHEYTLGLSSWFSFIVFYIFSLWIFFFSPVFFYYVLFSQFCLFHLDFHSISVVKRLLLLLLLFCFIIPNGFCVVRILWFYLMLIVFCGCYSKSHLNEEAKR